MGQWRGTSMKMKIGNEDEPRTDQRSKEQMRERERERESRREIEKKKERENIFLMEEEREI